MSKVAASKPGKKKIDGHRRDTGTHQWRGDGSQNGKSTGARNGSCLLESRVHASQHGGKKQPHRRHHSQNVDKN